MKAVLWTVLACMVLAWANISIGQDYIKASDPHPGRSDEFGWAIAASGDTLVVGAPGKAAAAGAVYVFVRSGPAWQQQAYLKAPENHAGDRFGYSVAIDGDLIVVGAPYTDGAATTTSSSTSTTKNNNTTRQVRLTNKANKAVTAATPDIAVEQPAGTPITDGGTVNFGSVGVGSTKTLTFTVRNAGDQSLTNIFASISGATTDYKVNARPTSTLAPNSSGTFSVAFKPTTAGARDAEITIASNDPDENPFNIKLNGTGTTGGGGTGDSGGAKDIGAAYVFERNGNTWTRAAKLEADNAEKGDFFGASVAISSKTIVVGATHESSSAADVDGDDTKNDMVWAGAAYVFDGGGSSWKQTAYLKASNPGPNDFFGRSVAIDGDIIVVGTDFEDSNGVDGSGGNNLAQNSGAAYVFVNNGGWSKSAYLKASNAGAGDAFGRAVAVVGDTIVVGAPDEDGDTTSSGVASNNAAKGAGAAYIFVTDDGTTWSQRAYLKAPNAGKGDNFGHSVALSAHGIVIGAPGEDSDAKGAFANVSDNDSMKNSGAAYLFKESDEDWPLFQYLKASNTGKGDQFGWSVAVSPVILAAVGAPQEDGAGSNFDDADSKKAANAGAAYAWINDVGVQQPAGFDLADGSTVDFSLVRPDDQKELTFTILNRGSTPLGEVAVSIIPGEGSSVFTISTNPPPSILAGGSATFKVVFKPTAEGSFAANLKIESNDADESPFHLNLTGTGYFGPEIAVVESPAGTDIPDAGSKGFGSVALGSNGSLTFTIENRGTDNLTGLVITKAGANLSDFDVTTRPDPIVEPNESTFFTVEFTPAAAGPRTATIHIASNDSDENPFDITLTGTGTAPEIAVEAPAGTNITDGGSKDYGSKDGGTSTSITFTIKNLGNANLTGLAITKDGPNAADFDITIPAGPVVPNGSTTFTVTFAPGATGARSAAIHIASNDPDESPFDINLTGTGTGVAPAAPAARITKQRVFGSSPNNTTALVNFGVEAAFSTWQAGNFSAAQLADPAISDLNTDPDHDGQSNWQEYIFGNLPLVPDQPPRLAMSVTGDELTISFPARAAAGPGYEAVTRHYAIETTNELTAANWKTLPGYSDITGVNQMIQCKVARNNASAFYRCKVWLAP